MVTTNTSFTYKLHFPCRWTTNIRWILLIGLFLPTTYSFSIRSSDATHNFNPLSLRSFQPTRTRISLQISNSDDTQETIGVGIDLGTTNSAIAFLDDNDVPQIIEIPHNGRTMKSVVALNVNDDGTTLVGNEAVQWEQQYNISAYRHVKRVLGTGSSYLSRDTANVVPHLIPGASKPSKKSKAPTLQKLLQDAEENPTMLKPLPTDTNSPAVAPEQVSAAILRHLLDVATQHTQKKIGRAVIGVPAYFNDAQREATIRAANLAGLDQVKLLREPEAAALAYGLDQTSERPEEFVLVFDLGGGTYDVSVLLIEEGLTEIVCTSGNAQLGGANFDARIAKRISDQTNSCCQSKTCSDMMVRVAECIRIYLSNNRRVNLALPLSDDAWTNLQDPSLVIVDPNNEDFEAGTTNSTHTFLRWTRKDVENFCGEELLELLRPIREVAIMAGALLPGDARPAAVESALELEEAFADDANAQAFYEEEEDMGVPAELQTQLDELDFKAAKKAQQKGRKKARQVAKQERKYRAESRKANEVQASKAAVSSMGKEGQVRADGITGRPLARVVLVGGATRMPAIGRLLSAVTGVTPQKTVDPDEAVALGCAVHVGILDGKENFGTVLNPMQAALLRAVVEKRRRDGEIDDDFFDDEDEFGEYEEMVMY